MLIFVQVYMTIDKFFLTIYEFWMNKREQRIEQKGSLKASEEELLLKLEALLKWWRHHKQVHHKQVHQKLYITRSSSS